MKATTAAITLPSSRAAFYSKKRQSPASLTKRKEDALRRTPTEVLAEQRKSTAQAERDMQSLLELAYQDDVRAYMSEMEVRRFSLYASNCDANFSFERQAKTTASVDLIDQQPELQWYMRPYLVDFLIEIHQQHRLRPETLYLALNIVDRYVSKRIVFKVRSRPPLSTAIVLTRSRRNIINSSVAPRSGSLQNSRMRRIAYRPFRSYVRCVAARTTRAHSSRWRDTY